MIQLIVNIILMGSIYLLIANSFTIIYTTSKFFHIAHAAIITLSGYLAFLFYKQLQFGIFISILGSIILCILFGLFFFRFLYYPLRKNNSSSLVLLLASLGIFIVIQNAIILIWGNNVKVLRNTIIKEGNEIFGAFITDIQLIIVITSLVLFLSTSFVLHFTRLGKKIRAVSSNKNLSNTFGIKSQVIVLWSFGIGSCLAAIAGILVIFNTDLTPTFGFNLLLYGVVAMIIGGVDSSVGILGGAFFLSIAQNLGAFYIDAIWMDAIAYIILILFLIWKPLGLSGKQLKKVEI